MSTKTRPGLGIAQSAEFIVARHLGEKQQARDLDTLISTIQHLDGTKADFREAIAYLAAQVVAERRLSDNRRLNDAQTVIDQVRRSLSWWDEAEERRSDTAALGLTVTDKADQ